MILAILLSRLAIFISGIPPSHTEAADGPGIPVSLTARGKTEGSEKKIVNEHLTNIGFDV